MKVYDIPYSEEEFEIEKCRESAEDGRADAQYELGECYFLGNGVEQDVQKSRCAGGRKRHLKQTIERALAR